MHQWPDCYWSESLSSTDCRLTKPLSPQQPLSQKGASVFTFDNCINEQACLLQYLNLGNLGNLGKRWLPNKTLRWLYETVRTGLNLQVLVLGHFLLAVQPWPAGADLATQADRHGRTHTHTHAHTHVQRWPTLPVRQRHPLGKRAWSVSTTSPCRILSSTPVQLIVLFTLERDR